VFEQCDLLHSGEPVERGVKVSIRTDFLYEVVHVEEGNEAMEVEGE